MALIKQLLGGFFIGIANVIPGISGGTMAVIFGVYDKMIAALSLDVASIKANFWFLIRLLIAIIIGILGFSVVISWLLTNYNSQTYGAFVGVIVGSLPLIFKQAQFKTLKVSYVFTFASFLAFMIVLWVFSYRDNIVVDVSNLTYQSSVGLLLAAGLSTMTMVIPGVSGSMLLVVIGYYEAIFSYTIRNLVMPHLIIVVIGMAAGLVLGAKLISYFINKHQQLIYAGIIGLIVGSIPQVFPTLTNPISTWMIMFICAIGVYMLNKKTGDNS